MSHRTIPALRATRRLIAGMCVRFLSWIPAAALALALPVIGAATAQVAAAPPSVNAGPDQTIVITSPAVLDGTATDDGVPSPLTVTWSKVSGPGNVTFTDPYAVDTTATFSASGDYVLRLAASDGADTITDDVTIEVMSTYRYSTQYEFDADPSTAEGVIDGDAGDANGAGVLSKLGTGTGNTGSGIANGVLHYLDNTGTGGGSNGYYWVRSTTEDISFTVDMRVKVNAGVTGGLPRRSMGFSAGNGKCRGLRLNQPRDSTSSSCTTGSVMFNSSTGGLAPEGCVDLTSFRQLRVSVNAVTSRLSVYDLESGAQLTSASGGASSVITQLTTKGGFQIGSVQTSDTTLTDFELDYFRVLLGTAVEDGTTLIQSLVACSASVTPAGLQTATATLPGTPSPSQIVYTIGNAGGAPVSYTVVEDIDLSWLSLDKSNGTIGVGGQDTVTATLNTNGLKAGSYRGYLRFTANCGTSPTVHVREVNLKVYDCGFDVTPACSIASAYRLDYPSVLPAAQTLTVRNGGPQAVGYQVAEVDQNGTATDYAWLSLNKATGTAPANGIDSVIAAIQPVGLAAGSYTAYLKFTSTSCSAPEVTRAVQLVVMGLGQRMTFEYDGNVDPLTAGFILKSETPMPVAQGDIEVDPDAIDGRVWRIQDVAGAKTKYVTASSPFMSGGVGATILGRVRVRSSTAPSMGGLFIWDNPSISAEVHWGGPSGRIKEPNRGHEIILTDPGRANDGFHIIRMTSFGTDDCNRVVRVYFDEDPTPVLEIPNAVALASPLEGFGFGAGSTDGTYDIAFDWVAGTNAGAFAPGEEVAVIGRSLVATNSFKCADADGDGDVDQTDFAVLQRCFTGEGGYGFDVANCACYDRDRDSDVDRVDVEAFEKCFSGPNIPWISTPECP